MIRDLKTSVPLYQRCITATLICRMDRRRNPSLSLSLLKRWRRRRQNKRRFSREEHRTSMEQGFDSRKKYPAPIQIFQKAQILQKFMWFSEKWREIAAHHSYSSSSPSPIPGPNWFSKETGVAKGSHTSICAVMSRGVKLFVGTKIQHRFIKIYRVSQG